MAEELKRLILAYQHFYGFSRLQTIKAIKQDLTELAKTLKPVKL